MSLKRLLEHIVTRIHNGIFFFFTLLMCSQTIRPLFIKLINLAIVFVSIKYVDVLPSVWLSFFFPSKWICYALHIFQSIKHQLKRCIFLNCSIYFASVNFAIPLLAFKEYPIKRRKQKWFYSRNYLKYNAINLCRLAFQLFTSVSHFSKKMKFWSNI